MVPEKPIFLPVNTGDRARLVHKLLTAAESSQLCQESFYLQRSGIT
jgi:hypothetical protein